MDAVGDPATAAHTSGIRRMLQAGVISVTARLLVSEWMHDRDNPKSGELVREVYPKYGAQIGPGMP